MTWRADWASLSLMHLSFLSPPLPLSLPPILSPCADGSHPPSLPTLAPLVPRPATSSPLCSAFALAAAPREPDLEGAPVRGGRRRAMDPRGHTPWPLPPWTGGRTADGSSSRAMAPRRSSAARGARWGPAARSPHAAEELEGEGRARRGIGRRGKIGRRHRMRARGCSPVATS